MAIGVTDITQDINSDVDAASYSSAAFTPSANNLMVICVVCSLGGGIEPTTPTITHNGITATHVYSLWWDTAGTVRKTFVAGLNTGASPASSVLTVNFGTTHLGCLADFFEVTGSDVVNGVAQTFVQGVGTTPGAVGTSGSVTLAAAGSGENRPFSTWSHQADEGKTPQASWSEIDDFAHAVPLTSMQTQWRSDAFETTASSSWATSIAYGGIGFEIKNLVVGGSVLVDPFGMSGFFGG